MSILAVDRKNVHFRPAVHASLVVDGGGWLTVSGVPDLPGYH
jgi:hypothetical protein